MSGQLRILLAVIALPLYVALCVTAAYFLWRWMCSVEPKVTHWCTVRYYMCRHRWSRERAEYEYLDLVTQLDDRMSRID